MHNFIIINNYLDSCAMLLICLPILTMSTNSCSADDTDLSCVFIPGGPSDLIPGIGCHTTHKTGCHGSLWSNLKYWHSDCRLESQTVSGASLFKMACLFCLSPLPFSWGFCMLYLERIIVRLRGQRGPFPFEWFFFDGFVFADQSQYKTYLSVEGGSFIHLWKTSATFS